MKIIFMEKTLILLQNSIDVNKLISEGTPKNTDGINYLVLIDTE